MSVSPLPKPGDKKPTHSEEEGQKNMRFLFWMVVVLAGLWLLGMKFPEIQIAGY